MLRLTTHASVFVRFSLRRDLLISAISLIVLPAAGGCWPLIRFVEDIVAQNEVTVLWDYQCRLQQWVYWRQHVDHENQDN